MPTITLKFNRQCGGGTGEHVSVDILVNAVKRREVQVTRGEIATTTLDDDLETAVRVLLRIYAQGKTIAQVKTGLTAGVNVVI